MISCTFAGHREVYDCNLESSIELTIESILKKDNSYMFYCGDMGEFDEMCSAAVRTAKRRHPEIDIKLMIVLPYMMPKVNTDKYFYKSPNPYNAGMNPKALQYIMGHANITMTLNYYVHATYDSAKAEMERLVA